MQVFGASIFTRKCASLEIVYTGSSALIEALVDAGISHLFANFGSDHPGIVETLAQARATGKPIPKVIT